MFLQCGSTSHSFQFWKQMLTIQQKIDTSSTTSPNYFEKKFKSIIYFDYLVQAEIDHLLLNAQFIKIYHMITKQIFTPFGLRKSPAQLSRCVTKLHALLTEWRVSIPLGYRPLGSGLSKCPIGDYRATHECLSWSYQYYEALLAVNGRWRLVDPTPLAIVEEVNVARNGQVICLDITKMYPQISSEIQMKTLLSDW